MDILTSGEVMKMSFLNVFRKISKFLHNIVQVTHIIKILVTLTVTILEIARFDENQTVDSIYGPKAQPVSPRRSFTSMDWSNWVFTLPYSKIILVMQINSCGKWRLLKVINKKGKQSVFSVKCVIGVEIKDHTRLEHQPGVQLCEL